MSNVGQKMSDGLGGICLCEVDCFEVDFGECLQDCVREILLQCFE